MDMMKLQLNMKENDAVSPVIGTILLVAITVVLIAIITAVVMGLAGSPGAKEVGLSVTPFYDPAVPKDGTRKGTDEVHGIIVVFHGGKDLSSLTNVSVLINNQKTLDGQYSVTDVGKYYYLNKGVDVGIPYKFRGSFGGKGSGTKEQLKQLDNAFVVITGTFADGTEQVIYEAKLNIPHADTW